MSNAANPMVLRRSEAAQMATDLGTAISNLIGLSADMDDTDKVFALDTLILLQTKRNVLEGELTWGKHERKTAVDGAAGLEDPAGLASQERGSLEAVDALRRALDAFSAADGLDYEGSGKNCGELARAAQLAATELAQTAACYRMARVVTGGAH